MSAQGGPQPLLLFFAIKRKWFGRPPSTFGAIILICASSSLPRIMYISYSAGLTKIFLEPFSHSFLSSLSTESDLGRALLPYTLDVSTPKQKGAPPSPAEPTNKYLQLPPFTSSSSLLHQLPIHCTSSWRSPAHEKPLQSSTPSPKSFGPS